MFFPPDWTQRAQMDGYKDGDTHARDRHFTLTEGEDVFFKKWL